LVLLKRNHLDEQFMARRAVRNLPEVITAQQEHMAKLSADMATVRAHADDAIVIGEYPCPRADLIAVLGKRLEALPAAVSQTTPAPIGRYRGLTFGLVLRPGFPPDVYLEGQVMLSSLMQRSQPGPRAVLNALENLAGTFAFECDRIRRNIAITQGQVRDHHARLGLPFIHEEYIAKLAALRQQLSDSLAGKPPAIGESDRPSVGELVAGIKSLKSSAKIEPQRPRVRSQGTAVQESVVTRIHRQPLQGAKDVPLDEIKPESTRPPSGEHLARLQRESSKANPLSNGYDR
jgi:hypothetical protein